MFDQNQATFQDTTHNLLPLLRAGSFKQMRRMELYKKLTCFGCPNPK